MFVVVFSVRILNVFDFVFVLVRCSVFACVVLCSVLALDVVLCSLFEVVLCSVFAGRSSVWMGVVGCTGRSFNQDPGSLVLDPWPWTLEP